MVSGKETTLATFQAGDVFGEVTLFDDGARSADVIANVDSSLLKISAEKFDRLAPTIRTWPRRCCWHWARRSPPAFATTTSGWVMITISRGGQ
jgi:CRP-like cAMP-binding protein